MKIFITIISFILFFNFLGFSQSDTLQIVTLNKLAWKLRTSNPDTSIVLGKKVLAMLNVLAQDNLFPKQWKEKTTAKTLYYMGIYHRYTGNYKMAFDYFEKALTLSIKINYPFVTSQTYSGMGNLYLYQGAHPKALEYYLRALQIDEALGFKTGIATDLANIGNIYEEKNNSDKALYYYNKALQIALLIKDEEREAVQLGNIGVVYYTQNNIVKALEYYNKALIINKKINNLVEMANNLSNIASIYKDKKEYQTALDYLNQALLIDNEVGNGSGISLGNIGVIYYLMKDYIKAESYLLKAIAISEEINDLESLQEFEETLSNLYEKNNKVDLALLHFKKHTQYTDSMFNEVNTKKIVVAELNYEFDKKQTAVKFEHDKVVYKLESENKLHKQLRIFFIVSILLILGLLFFAKRAYDNKKKVADFMASESNRKETLLQEVHHRINNNLQIISSLLSLQANSANDARLTEYLNQSQNRLQSLSVLHELLYQNDSSLQINMKEYLNKVLDFHRDVLNTLSCKVEMELNIAQASFPTKIAVPISLIVNELVTNSIKYAFTDAINGSIIISLNTDITDETSWVLTVKDSGKGLPTDTNYRKDSLGLRLVKIMTKQIKGNLETFNEQGAVFKIKFNA